MNELIKKLAEQATIRKWRGDGTDSIPKLEFDKEKFAELIINECLGECWYDYTPKQISDNIKTKFGVKE